MAEARMKARRKRSQASRAATRSALPALPHRIVVIGLDVTGLGIAKSLACRTDCEIVGGVDVDPKRIGRDLGELLGSGVSGVKVVSTFAELESLDVDLAVVATTSLIEQLEETATPLLEAGINVVSICEELGYPLVTHPAVAHRLDAAARASGVSILGTGINPGFVMDTLPLVLSTLTQKVDRIEIRRTAEMSGYGALLGKFGLGLKVDVFDAAQAAGKVVGHVGFEQALTALGDGLGWTFDEVGVDPVRPAFHHAHKSAPSTCGDRGRVGCGRRRQRPGTMLRRNRDRRDYASRNLRTRGPDGTGRRVDDPRRRPAHPSRHRARVRQLHIHCCGGFKRRGRSCFSGTRAGDHGRSQRA